MAVAPPPVSLGERAFSLETGGGVGEEVHRPVLVKEILEGLSPKSGGVYVDGTLGNAGHAVAILEASNPDGFLLGIDQDNEILQIARERLRPFEKRVRLIQGNFSSIADVLKKEGFASVDGLLLDLGISSLQVDRAERGFSFNKEGPLDMRMDPSSGETVLEKIRESNEEELAKVFREYGEERLANKIARGVFDKMKRGELNTTLDLAQVAYLSYSPAARHKKIHPATRIFQSLRIWVNRELEVLKIFLKQVPSLLKPNGRLCIISYHSLDDRIVKHTFRQCVKEREDLKILTKKPVRPSQEEVAQNSRARSAKLRVLSRMD